MNIENELSQMDFSRFSKIKNKLLNDLLERRNNINQRCELSMEELEMAAAARGQNNSFQKQKNKIEN